MAKHDPEWHLHRGRGLMTAGLVLLVLGALRYYNVGWPVALMIVGVILLVKGFIIKSMKGKYI